MKRGLREYWEEQLSEYRNSGLTIQEYSDLKDLPYETGRRWTVYLKKVRAGSCSIEAGGIDFPTVGSCATSAGVDIKVRSFTISLNKGFDPSTQIAVINLLQEVECSASAVQ